MKILLTFNGNPIYSNPDGSDFFQTPYFAVDSDGTGSSHGDTYQQKETSLRPFLNADIDQYAVVPPMYIRAVPGIVLGCQGLVKRVATGVIARFVVGDVSNDAPTRKLGEGSIALARALGINPSPVSGGSDEVFEWTIIPGAPARVGSKSYQLQPFHH